MIEVLLVTLMTAFVPTHVACSESATLHEAWGIPDIEDRLVVCTEVASRAEAADLPVAVLVELAWGESRWAYSVNKTSGCSGPLQASPKWWCPKGKKKEGCDLVAAGFLAFTTYRAKHETLLEALCHYKSGNVCQPAALKGAKRVVRDAERLRFAMGGRS